MPEPVDISNLYADARSFLTDLAQNNTRDWFAAHKDTYDSRLKRPAEKLMSDLAPELETRFGQPVKRKIFRPHRDVRFTEDKTPYHTHLHLMWSLADGRTWMFGLSPDYATAGAGIMGFSPPQLDRWREAAARDDGVRTILDTGGWRLPDPDLKRVPAPYPADHPCEELLRRKGLAAWQDNLDDAVDRDPLTALSAAFEGFDPLLHWLAQVA